MRYSFKSGQQHNFISLLKGSAYQLAWPIILTITAHFLFPESKIVKDNIHLYTCLIIEAFSLFSISKDSINEITIDSSAKLLQVNYYNIYQGQKEEKFSFDKVKINITENRKKEIKHIIFFIKGKNDFLVDNLKDKFNQQELESLAATLYHITSPKTI